MPPSRRDDLIDAAVAVFSRHGYHGTGLDKVLAEGDISRMTLYNHFKSKDELIVAAIERQGRCFADKMMAFVDAADAPDPADRLLAVFDYFVQWTAQEGFCGCMFINASAEFEDAGCAVRRAAAASKRWVLDYLARLAKSAHLREPDDLALALLLLIEGTLVTTQVLGQAPDDPLPRAAPAQQARAAAATLIEAHRA